MSNTDSFIDEVTEDLRRDRLFGYVRRYGWIAALAVVALVGGAAWTEWQKAQTTAAAQAAGDAVIDASTGEDAAARAAALASITAADPKLAAVLKQLQAVELLDADQRADAVAVLQTIAQDGGLPRVYRDLAALKALTLAPEQDLDSQRLGYEALAQPGAPFRLLAMEQLAYLEAGAGNAEAARDGLQRIVEDAETTASQRQRIADALTALGAVLPADGVQ